MRSCLQGKIFVTGSYVLCWLNRSPKIHLKRVYLVQLVLKARFLKSSHEMENSNSTFLQVKIIKGIKRVPLAGWSPQSAN